MHAHLWAGVDRKLQEALFYFNEMARSLQSAIWQESFYAHVDTLLAKVRSVPEVIESCFGADRVLMQTKWFGQLPDDEQKRRRDFSKRFRKAREKFSKHHLTNERNTSEHRLGYPGVEGKVIGPFGEVHTASPVERIPTAESRRFGNPGNDPALQWAATQPPQPVEPRWDQFTIGGKPLFDECRAYVQLACDLRGQASNICQQVHASYTVTPPPCA